LCEKLALLNRKDLSGRIGLAAVRFALNLTGKGAPVADVEQFRDRRGRAKASTIDSQTIDLSAVGRGRAQHFVVHLVIHFIAPPPGRAPHFQYFQSTVQRFNDSTI
jgi:hypothetical protein